MSKIDIKKIAKNSLSDLLDKPGSILYSSHETLKPGDIYLLGFNPGGAGGNPIASSIDSIFTNTENAYLDEIWENKNGAWKKGEAPLQKRIKWIVDSLGLQLHDVCASNLIFFQSRSASDISFSLAQKCWPVHEAIIELVKPKLLLCFGNSSSSPYAYLHALLGGEEESIPSGHGNWLIKGFSSSIHERHVYVAGLPHLSRYSPIGNTQVVEWLSGKI